MLFGPIRTPFELLDQELDLTLVLADTVRLPAPLAKDATADRLLMALLSVKHRGLIRLRCPRLVFILHILHVHLPQVNLLALIWSLVNPHRITILNLAWPVQLDGLLARDRVGIAAFAVLGGG